MDIRFQVTDGMHCASCVRRFEQALEGVPGVTDVQVDLAARRARIATADGGPSIPDLTARLATAGFTVTSEAVTVRANPWPALIALALAIVTFLLPHPLALAVAALALIGPGFPILRSGLRWGAPGMDALIVLGGAAAFAAGEPHATAVTVALTLVGRLIEARARAATGAAVERLASRIPATAVRVTAAGDETVPVARISLGERVRLRPGDAVPVDGTVAEGALSLDEALLTGESLPVERAAGMPVAAGTRVVDGTAVITATGVGATTAVARIADLVQRAAVAKPTVQRLVDRIAAWFVPAVALIALGTWAGWYVHSGDPWRGLLPAAAVLVIACPCALGLATPTALVAAVGRLARHGIYVLTPRALEAAAGIDTVAFDKTGTLTTGQFRIERIAAEDPHRVLRLAAAVEQGSEHPLALAIRCAWLEKELAPSRGIVQDVSRFTHRAGGGAGAEVDGGAVLVGSADFMRANGIEPREEPTLGGTMVHVALNGTDLGVIALTDAEREEAVTAVAALAPRRVVLITGDREVAARAVATRLGIDEAIARCRPEQKLEQIQRLRAGGARVAFVGDGINDAPALAGADLGIAIGSGTDVARASADAVLAGGDLGGVPRLLDTARACRRVIVQNLLLASGYNLVALPFAAAGLVHPGLAAGAMAVSSLLVVGNSLRLR